MSFKDMVIEDRRYLILKALNAAAGYSAAVGLLQAFLDSFGQKVSSDLLEGDLAWLAEQGLIEIEKPDGVTIAKLKARGADIAEGRSVYPGIRKPKVDEL